MRLTKSFDPESAKRFVWRLRDDLRQGRPASAPPDAAFDNWWLVRGRADYPAWSVLSDQQCAWLAERTGTLTLGSLKLAMPRALGLVLQSRADVRQHHSVEGQIDALGAAAWFFMRGLREHQMTGIIDSGLLQTLDQPLPYDLVPQLADMPSPTVLMRLVWQLLDDEMRTRLPLQTAEGRRDFLAWFFGFAVQHFDIACLLASRWRHWLLQDVCVLPGGDDLVPRFAWLEHELSGPLRQQIALAEPAGPGRLAAWAHRMVEPGGRYAWLRQPRALVQPAPAPSPAANERPFGVNLYGFAFGELGIGEDLRMAVDVCDAAGIPYRVVNIDAGQNLRQADDRLAEQVGLADQQAPYAINVFCMPGFDTVARVWLKLGAKVFEGHYNIGWWPWELPVWPRAWAEAFDLVDEVWAGSDFARQMYLRSTTKPVRLMPLPVDVRRGVIRDRSYFGLPERKFLFLFVFDFNSWLARKNPHAVVHAFAAAFSPHDHYAQLVLKVMNAREDDPRWQEFRALCDRNPRIRLMTETLDRPDVLALIRACNAYVSLHRAEGFGRTLAEAMLYGKPVVATAYSGNVDFMPEGLSFPVAFEPIALQPGDYAFVEPQDGATWAEPSLESAAEMLRRARRSTADKGFATRVMSYAQQQFSVERTAAILADRLREVACGIGLPKA